MKLTLESRMISHMAFDTFHLLKNEFTIKGEGLPNDRVFYSETKTPKRRGEYGKFGKPQTFYYFESTEKGKEFKTVIELLDSVGLNKEMFKKE